MPLPQTSPQNTTSAALPGVTVIARIRRVLIVAASAAVLFPAFMSSSKGYCPGGFDENGGFIDATGKSVEEAPQCVQLTLAPGPLVFVGIALIVLIAIGRVMKATDEHAALRTLDRSAIAVAALVVVAIVVSQVWFQMVPLDDFNDGSWSLFSPFPFGNINVEITPMTTP